MASKQNILVTGTGGIAKAIVRALVPVGYHVRTVGIEPQGVTVFEKLFPERDAYPQRCAAYLHRAAAFGGDKRIIR